MLTSVLIRIVSLNNGFLFHEGRLNESECVAGKRSMKHEERNKTPLPHPLLPYVNTSCFSDVPMPSLLPFWHLELNI